jgi:hypothetical protein
MPEKDDNLPDGMGVAVPDLAASLSGWYIAPRALRWYDGAGVPF